MIIYKEFDSFKDIENLKEDWDRCVLECNSPVYMTFDWCKTWWDFYGDKMTISIILFYSDSNLVGILPVYFQKIFIGPFSIKVCRLIGSNIPPKIFNPPININYQASVLELFLQNILNRKCDVVSIGPVSEDYFSDEILNGLINKTFIGNYVKENYDFCMSMELPDNFQAYLESISNREKRAYKKNIKGLNNSYKISIDINYDFDERDFKNFQEMHHTQWLKRGMLGHFKSWPFGKEFHDALAKKQAELRRLVLIKILKNNEVVFIAYGYIFNKIFYFQLFARSISTEDEKFSLGTIGHGIIAEYMISQKVKIIELGPGYYDYKIDLGAKAENAFTYRFIADKSGSIIKNRIVKFEKKIRDLVVHKIWYRRIQPSLPALFKQPLSNRSIKLDY